MCDGTVRMWNALAALGVVASPLLTVLVFIVE
jgi:hypothetical protein